MNTAFWLMFANFCILACINFSTTREKNALRKERGELLKKNCDLQDEIHHLKVKYGELPMTCWIVQEDGKIK